MTVIPDDELFKYSDRVKDKVVLITGDDNFVFVRLKQLSETFRRRRKWDRKRDRFAIWFLRVCPADCIPLEIANDGRYLRAKVVIGDRDVAGALRTAEEIRGKNGLVGPLRAHRHIIFIFNS